MRLALPFLLLAAPAAALDLSSMTPDERDAFRAEVRAFLLENPEVLVEAIDELDRRQAAEQAEADRALVAANAPALFEDPASWTGGNPEGSVTIVEFMDYKCGYCRRAFQEVEDLVAGDDDLRFVLKEFPILGPESELASRFAVAVRQLHGDAAYKDVHDALMVMESDITPDTLSRLAEGLGLDPIPILARLAAPEVTAVIDANRALGQAMAITGTPTFVIGDGMVRGYVPLSELQAIVADERAG